MDFEEMRGAYQRATQDDIVTQLRELATFSTPSIPRSHLIEAADEIERLRKQLADKQ